MTITPGRQGEKWGMASCGERFHGRGASFGKAVFCDGTAISNL
jgi:hypothetical protein